MMSGLGRIAVAAVLGMALVGGPALADQLDAPTVWQTGSKVSSVRLSVKAGVSGADAGFTAQWMTKAAFDANGGWAEAGSPSLRQADFSGAPVWTTEGNAGDYTLAPSQWMAIELGQLFDESGVIAEAGDNEELAASTQYVVRVFARATGGLDASNPTADLVVTTGDPAQNCTYTVGYWKNHPGAWPASSLTLGTINYTAAELLSILNTPAGGNGLVILAHQLIAAKLNIQNGADGSAINATIAAADAQIGGLVVPPVGTDFLAAASTSADAHTLDDWNNGITGPGHCAGTPVTSSTWGKLKSTYRQ
jgi:hypothetical protein